MGHVYLDGILTSCTRAPLDECISCIDHTPDTVSVGVKLCLERLVFLVLALKAVTVRKNVTTFMLRFR